MEILTPILTFLAGLGAGWTLKVVITNRSDRSIRFTAVSQKGNFAGRDIVAGDVSKKD